MKGVYVINDTNFNESAALTTGVASELGYICVMGA